MLTEKFYQCSGWKGEHLLGLRGSWMQLSSSLAVTTSVRIKIRNIKITIHYMEKNPWSKNLKEIKILIKIYFVMSFSYT